MKATWLLEDPFILLKVANDEAASGEFDARSLACFGNAKLLLNDKLYELEPHLNGNRSTS